MKFKIFILGIMFFLGISFASTNLSANVGEGGGSQTCYSTYDYVRVGGSSSLVCGGAGTCTRQRGKNFRDPGTC